MLGTLMLPYQATLVPQYVLFYNLGWLRTFNPITIPGYFAGGAAMIFLLGAEFTRVWARHCGRHHEG